MRGCSRPAPRPCIVFVFPSSLFELEGPFILLFIPLLLSGCALRPIATTCYASTTEGRLELPRRESKHRLWPSSRIVGVCRRKERRSGGRNGGTRVCGGWLEKGPSIWLDLVTWTVVWVWCLPLGVDGDGLAKGEAAHAFPVFGRVVEPAVADAFWAATAPFAARLPTG